MATTEIILLEKILTELVKISTKLDTKYVETHHHYHPQPTWHVETF